MWLKIRLPKWIKLRAMLESSRCQGVTHKEWPTSRIGIHEAMFFFTAEVPHTDEMFRDMRLPVSLGEAPIWVRVLVWFTAVSAWWIQNFRWARWLDRGGWGRNLFVCSWISSSLKDSLEKKDIIDNHRPSKERLWTYLDSRQRSKICVFVLRFLKEWGYNMDTTFHTGILPNIWEDLTCQYESFVLSATSMGEVRLDCVAINYVIVTQDVDAFEGEAPLLQLTKWKMHKDSPEIVGQLSTKKRAHRHCLGYFSIFFGGMKFYPTLGFLHSGIESLAYPELLDPVLSNLPHLVGHTWLVKEYTHSSIPILLEIAIETDHVSGRLDPHNPSNSMATAIDSGFSLELLTWGFLAVGKCDGGSPC